MAVGTRYGANKAALIRYTNLSEPTVTNVEEALDLLLYVSPSISSFSNSVGTVEIGSTVTGVVLTWSYNKTMTTATLTDAGSISAALLTYSFSGLSLTSNKTYTLTAGDGTNTTSSSTSVYFRHKRYWGTNSSTSILDADIIAMSKEFSTTRVKSVWSQNGNGEYIYYCYPASWGAAEFWVNGLLNTSWTLTTRAFVNSSGYSESFRIYRTNTVQYGTGIQIEVR